ncbi:MAG: hypothetical protein A2365_03350 [Candidatus Nealsonbacteria bacterium RIFOXYB1_FULL_40_15]|uniref:SHS2 domain-containing protein n=2 Tax=Candidatus Nealsoniibacteriota TaxID=1817911 RepID=A0A1G2ETZ2_9BACT|nr:MAG: hypothetical protein A2365_03350 [Candidatus Nealsonbacteria bacterium RIFOXYB1_FULL_40_15]OGZ28820.1 MAG: hypothetical protein A2427_00155 [Candidatus Nealsonbacteria bacterium RIFOXYC1_FULL_40_7]OGZ29376.1 MAG: hypothetical protein A2562_04690 [Candidatus Nealsonbacteria bacterium RIFOXYD1_FULL_39_11]
MLEGFRRFLSFGSKRFLGIDIGTSSVRVVELARKKNELELTNYGELKSSSFIKKPFRILTKNSISFSNDELGKILKAIVEEAEIETKEVNLGIPDFASFFTSFEVPVMAKNEISQAVQYEVRPYVPLPLTEVTLDWTIISGEPSKTPLKVLVVAIPNDIIAQYQEIARIAGLELKTLESEVFALTRAVAMSNRGSSDENKVLGLLDIGARSSTCSIVDKGVLKTSHSFKIGGNELTEVVAKSLNIDYNEGEEIKLKHGLLPDNGLKRDIRKVLVPLVDSILEEMREAFRSFYRQEGKEVEKVVLAGGVANMPGIKDYFQASLKKDTSLADPFLNIRHPAVITNNLKESGPLYAVAVGLALNGLEYGNKSN